MYAIVDIAGQQFKVAKDQKLFVHRLEGEAGSKVSFDKVLLIDNDSKVTVGTPSISGAAISATVIEHLKGDKVLVFKKKRRKGYKKLNGHRQLMTRIQITEIMEKGAKAPVAKKEAVKAEAEKPAAKAVPKTAAKPASAKATADKPAAEKKPAAKKPAAKATADKPAVKKPAAKKPAAKATADKPAAKTTAAKPAAKKADDDKKAADKE